MIRKNILAIALLGVFGLSHAADVENLRTLSYLNEPLRLQADVVGEGEIILAAPTEYLRLNHPIPSYDLSINVVEQNGQKQVVLTTTEEIESPALTLLLESRDQDNRRQLFELPIILDFKPEPSAEPAVAEATDSEIVIDGVTVDAPVATTATDKVALAEVPTVAKKEEKPVAVPVKAEPEKAKPEVAKAKVEKEAAKAPAKAVPKVTNPELLKRYPVEKGETLWSIANKVRPANVTPQKMIQIIKANNPSAFTAGGVLRADVTLLIPTETPKVKHNFVASADANAKSDVRVGYIYELPEPPVQQVAEPAKAVEPEVAVVESPDEVSVKVVRPVSTTETVTQDVTTIVPANDQPVDSVEVIQPEVVAPVVVEPQQPVVVTPVETVSVVAPVVEVTQPEVAEPVKAVEPAKEEVVKPAEPPKKRPVYVMPEPEPEPGIVELIFENIVYIGAGALVLILGLLAVVMRRRKGDEPKQPKEKKVKVAKAAKESTEQSEQVETVAEPKKKGLFGKKKDAVVETKAPKAKKEKKESKGLFGFGKKKVDTAPAEQDVVEVQAVETVTEAPVAQPVKAKPVAKPQVAPVAAAIATAAVATAVAAPKAEAKDETTIESLDFDLSFTEDAAPAVAVVTEEKEEAGLDFDLSSLDLGTTTVEVEASKAEESMDGLDFDLSSFDLGTTTVETEASKAEESMGGLDFDLSSLDLGTTAIEVEVPKAEESMGGLDFDLSSLDLGTTTSAPVEEAKTEDYGGLDFDLSTFSTPSVEAELPKEESFDMGATLDFDLGEFKVEETPAVVAAVEEIIETPVATVMEADSFGENNPLFAVQTGTESAIDAIADEAALSDSNEPEEYISFPDLLENAEDTLVKDDIEAEKPVDFGSFMEDEEAGLANLMETSKSDVAESKIDLSFVADTSEDEAGLAFLDTLDLSEEAVLDDPINSSVRDNVAKSMESIDAPEPVEIDLDALDLPTLDAPAAEAVTIEEPAITEIEVPEITLMEPMIEEPAIEIPEVTLVEPVIAEPVVEEIAIPEVTLAEPVIEEVVIPEPIIEPVVAPVSQAAVVETLDTTHDADFESEQVKLELAVAYMDFDKSLAKPLLDEVVKDGSPSQIERAKALLAQIN